MKSLAAEKHVVSGIINKDSRNQPAKRVRRKAHF